MIAKIGHFNSISLCVVLFLSGKPSSASETIEGFSHPDRTAEVAASTPGIVKNWLVSEGDSVRAGQPLVQLDDTVHQALMAIAASMVESRGEIELAEAEQKLKGLRLTAIKELSAKGHATPDELNRAETEWAVASARLLAAQENQHRRELELKKLHAQAETFSVAAPFTGVVTKIQRVAGEYVGPVEPTVCTLAELETLSARFLVPDTRLDNLATGARVKVQFVTTDRIVEGVATVTPFPDAETGMRSVQVKLPNPNGDLEAGVRCRLLFQDAATMPVETPASPTGGI